MNLRPLLVFDFDGVIVDGMAEYWWSAWHACRRLDAAPEGFTPDQVPDAFRQLRPWVHHGWEMVLLAAELPALNLQVWLQSYGCLLYTSPSPRDGLLSRMPSSA